MGLVATVAAFLLAGCGSSVESAVRSDHHADHVSCDKAGAMVYLAERETVWDCQLDYRGPDPARFEFCYVLVDGHAVDVTGMLDDRFACVRAK